MKRQRHIGGTPFTTSPCHPSVSVAPSPRPDARSAPPLPAVSAAHASEQHHHTQHTTPICLAWPSAPPIASTQST